MAALPRRARCSAAACSARGLVGAALALLLCASSAAGHYVLHDSPYFSKRNTTSFPTGDLANADVLAAALRARVFKGELVVVAFNEHSLDWMLHYVYYMRRKVGLGHYLVVGASKACCDALQAALDNLAVWPGCAWVTLPGTPATLPESIHLLWLSRFYAAHLAVSSGVNVLLSDLDVAFHRDFYVDFKAPPLSGYNLFVLWSEINGGLWYVQNAARDGAVAWVLRQVAMRGLQTLLYTRVTGDNVANGCPADDQPIFQMCLYTLSRQKPPDFWPCLKSDTPEAWAKVGIEPTPVAGQLTDWTLNWVSTPIEQPLQSPNEEAICKDAVMCERLRMFKNSSYPSDMFTRMPTLELQAPDSYGISTAVERVARPPAYVMDGQESMLNGWNNLGEHTGVAWGALSHTIAFGNAFGNNRGGRNNRLHIFIASHLWSGRVHIGSRFLALSPQYVAQEATSEQAFRQLIKTLTFWAAVYDRLPIIPSVDCGVSWMRKTFKAAHNVFAEFDCNFIPLADQAGVFRCHPYLSYGDCTHNQAMPEFMNTHQTNTELAELPAAGDVPEPYVTVSRLRQPDAAGLSEEQSRRVETFKQRCADFA